jgi:hypothetical protein
VDAESASAPGLVAKRGGGRELAADERAPLSAAGRRGARGKEAGCAGPERPVWAGETGLCARLA